MRCCSKCGEEKAIIAFSKTSPGVCRVCYNQRKKTWRLANPLKQKNSEQKWMSSLTNKEIHKLAMSRWYQQNKKKLKQSARKAHLAREYGLSEEDYERMYVEQGGKCVICSGWQNRLCVDHDHQTGRVRQLLCRRCNAAIGSFEEDIRLLAQAIDYLVKWRETAQPPKLVGSGTEDTYDLGFVSPMINE